MSFTRLVRVFLVFGASALLLPPSLGTAGAAPSPSRTCLPAGGTGLTAAVVATTGQIVTGTIDATGCNVGVYVGPWASSVVISGATITGAKDHGIFIQDTSNVLVENSTVSGNGVSPTPGIPENKAIELVGTSYSVVRNNIVTGNMADGGIGVSDDGMIDPGAARPGSPHPAMLNSVIGNRVTENGGGCGIVVASYNSSVSNNLVANNTVVRNPAGIVVAADAPNTSVKDNWVMGNAITDNSIPGVIIHSNAPGDTLSGTVVQGNVISGNGFDPEVGLKDPTRGAGIILVGEVAPVTNTFIAANGISHEYFGVWERNASGTLILNLGLNHATVPDTLQP
jgi:parallel beta-helix repeat protein